MNKPAWAAFWLVAFIWGSSFLLIRVGVEDIPATELVFFRILIAAVGLNIVLKLRGQSLPRDWPTIRSLILIGGGNVAIPYTLISLSEQTITSGMAAVLQATASLFTLIIAHFTFADERITGQKILGLVVGFAGVIVLYSNSIVDGKIDTSMLLGQMGMVVASMFYAMFIAYSRVVIGRNTKPMVVSAGSFTGALLWIVPFIILEPLLGGRAFISPTELPSKALLAAGGLGFINTFIAYLFFYYIISELGSFRASMVTYVVPVVGLILGAVVLHEIITLTMIIGAAMIFTGIGIVNLKFRQLVALRARPAQG